MSKTNSRCVFRHQYDLPLLCLISNHYDPIESKHHDYSVLETFVRRGLCTHLQRNQKTHFWFNVFVHPSEIFLYRTLATTPTPPVTRSVFFYVLERVLTLYNPKDGRFHLSETTCELHLLTYDLSGEKSWLLVSYLTPDEIWTRLFRISVQWGPSFTEWSFNWWTILFWVMENFLYRIRSERNCIVNYVDYILIFFFVIYVLIVLITINVYVCGFTFV